MNELWRTLNEGDRVRVVAWPSELARDRLHAETIACYEWFIQTGEVLRVAFGDDGMPWGHWEGTIDGAWRSEELPREGTLMGWRLPWRSQKPGEGMLTEEQVRDAVRAIILDDTEIGHISPPSSTRPGVWVAHVSRSVPGEDGFDPWIQTDYLWIDGKTGENVSPPRLFDC